jgi:hypothetical protein
MRYLKQLLVHEDGGHAAPALGLALGVIGALALAVGAVGDRSLVTVVGGVVLACGLVAVSVGAHATVDHAIYRRLDELERARRE